MNDKVLLELLELAAQATNIEVVWRNNSGAFYYDNPDTGREEFDPLTDDGDAMISERNRVLFLISIIENLWGVIDDIDSYSDMAKADDKLYRHLVERRQKDRWQTGITTDGYSLNIPPSNVELASCKKEYINQRNSNNE